MNLNPEGVAKAVYVGFLLILWAALIKLGINDSTLIDVIKALIGVIVGWHGINEWGGVRRAAQPVMGVATLGAYQPVSAPLDNPPASGEKLPVPNPQPTPTVRA